ncbi:phosphoribosylanthranilate isomerase [Terrihalobacillus insolitus]|uniref:phosphoribosylanthranilate isomerase n=1 Tax=Terrihalobacillus insolitus TaxID=2950438 RepID=UPI002341DDBA|nr:phosphoribosylanthranilate isomerase [Terrihalobacillus insolitus]MDC3414813.1 phosphoribosylanthranilate isomerase [Terrihalobacillus insolitus]
MQVKICGVKTIDAAQHAVQNGADLIGFVFAKSKRRITKEQAKEIAQIIPEHVKKVGVFVNEPLDSIKDIAATVGLDYVQLHGDETPEFCEAVPYPVIKAFSIQSKEDFYAIRDYKCDYFLLDSPSGKYRGGNGTAFDWSLTKHLSNVKGKVILAGGLSSENVSQAIAEANPQGVDVSSGVETDGEKDLNKITAFIREAKQATTIEKDRDHNDKLHTP